MFEPVNCLPENISAVILAGGLGTRIQHLLPGIPKPMAPVRGKPFLEWVLRYLRGQGLRHAVVSSGYLSETIQAHFASQPVEGMEIRCVAEPKPLGTAGGFLHAIRTLPSGVPGWLVLNGDSLALAPLGAMFELLAEDGVEGAILGLPVPDAARYGTMERNAAGDLIGFKEKRPGAGVINAGVYLLRSTAVNFFSDRMPLSFERDVFPELIARQRRLKVCVTDASFLDIGTPESLPLAESFVRENAAWFEPKNVK